MNRTAAVDPVLEEEINNRQTTQMRRSPTTKTQLTEDRQWQSRREKMLQDYKTFAATDLQAADAKRMRSKPHLTAKPEILKPEKTRISPPRPVFQPPTIQRNLREADQSIQTYPNLSKIDHSSECLLEQYPAEDLNYSQLMGNWEHTNPYVWADLLFHRKRMEMERELEETRRRQTYGYDMKNQETKGPDTLQQRSSLPYRQEVQGPPAESGFYVTPPDPEYVSSHSSQPDADGPSPYVHRPIPGHIQVQADISKVQYDIDSETQKLDRILMDLKRLADQSSKDYRESLKEFEMLKEDLKMTALETEIRHRNLQSVLEEPYSYAFPTAFMINAVQLTSELDPVPYDEPQLLSSESVFLPSHMVETPQEDEETWDSVEKTQKAMIQSFNEPFNYRLRVEPGESVSIAGIMPPQEKPEGDRLGSFNLEEAEMQRQDPETGFEKPREPISHSKESPQEGETLI